jgi:hypothetical protein
MRFLVWQKCRSVDLTGFDALSNVDFEAQSRPINKLTHPHCIGFFFMLEAGQLYLFLNSFPPLHV